MKGEPMTDTATTDTPEVDAPEVDTLGTPPSTEPLDVPDVEVTTLAQPVPIQRDDTPGAPGEPTLVWVDELTPVGVGPEPPAEGGGGEPIVATGATAGTPGTFTPVGAVPPMTIADCAGVTASPTTAWATGEHVALGDASHAHWDGAAWAEGDAP
jgi:hypothetical protein